MDIKIFGERNTATNALGQLIKINSNTKLHPGTMAELDKVALKRTQYMKKFGLGNQRIENVIDKVFDAQPIEHSWKHSTTYFNNKNIPSNTHFVFMVRHPISWFVSLYKNPYHCLIEKPKTLVDFYSCQWKTVRRDNLEKKFYRPIELYAEKLKSYRDFISILESREIGYTLLKFEDFVTNQKACLEQLRENLNEPTSNFSELKKSTKDSTKNLEYYRDYYTKELWRDELDPNFLNLFEFDEDLLVWTNYQL